jgi:DnaJ domain
LKQPFGAQKNKSRISNSSAADLECKGCGVVMTAHFGAQNRIRYYRCRSCGRRASSTYSDALRGDAKVRIQSTQPHLPRSPQFQEVKERLERWMSALDRQDPYYLLGVSPLDSAEAIRNRYRELALSRHPDRGGSSLEMAELNLAYERIVRHRTASGCQDRAPLMPSSLPAPRED